ncbi:MAG: 1-acyl-sn-glycerol-3-phosphate acyltransferase [Thiohalocapsa sp.]|jgi:1-acyl-sn-glycerol-3-phosphate acyltransferase|uniref:lysophospholipid acyltransferase family protein n=1 Tax=Thiohalocapsa sp. TaxID=2497641 RepID=UPI0025EB2179|nr:lysophospholipid acyltransferase family protein [Thiohalocapsa sp.]MCG6941227.1 1-acyl-sn-glycerol-3-phosphate acyltransferase [Thiohalocapsa sp.]
MTLFRSLLFLLAFSLTVVGFGGLILVSSAFAPDHVLHRIARGWSLTVLALLRAICGLSYRVHGLENLPDGPSVLMCKHQSAWETVALPSLLPVKQSWVLKQELIRIPFYGWALRALKPIAINRATARAAMKQLLSDGAAALAQGRSVLIFPEGTRVAVGQRRPFSIGGAILAERCGVPVVPIAHNSGVYWERRGILRHSGCVEVVVGESIPAADHSAKEINRRAEDWINAQVDSLPT